MSFHVCASMVDGQLIFVWWRWNFTLVDLSLSYIATFPIFSTCPTLDRHADHPILTQARPRVTLEQIVMIVNQVSQLSFTYSVFFLPQSPTLLCLHLLPGRKRDGLQASPVLRLEYMPPCRSLAEALLFTSSVLEAWSPSFLHTLSSLRTYIK